MGRFLKTVIPRDFQDIGMGGGKKAAHRLFLHMRVRLTSKNNGKIKNINTQNLAHFEIKNGCENGA